MYNNELYHHGILGQRWGVRRYQNRDGTLTKAGLARKNKSVHEDTGPFGERHRRHISDNNADDYTLKKGTKVTRWLKANEYMDKTIEQISKSDEKNDNKYGSVDNIINRGVNGTDFYYNWFSDGGLDLDTIQLDTYVAANDLKIANAHKVVDMLINKYGDMSVSEFLGDDHYKLKRLDKASAKLLGDSKVKNVYKDVGVESDDAYFKKRIDVGESVTNELLRKTVNDHKLWNEFSESLKKQGYDGVEDAWDRDTSMPVRFFNATTSLKKVSSENGEEFVKRRRRELGL